MKSMQLILTVIGAVIGGGLVQWLLAPTPAQAQDETVRAQKFELVDAKGNVRARMSATGGNTEFELWGEDLTTNVAVRVKKDGSAAITLPTPRRSRAWCWALRRTAGPGSHSPTRKDASARGSARTRTARRRSA